MPARIVVLLDRPDFTAAVRALLSASGYDTASLPNSMATLEALENAAKIELLITCPEFAAGPPTGIALARMARIKRPDVKTLFVGPPGLHKYAEGLGEYLAYPATAEDVAAAVNRMLPL
jgi:hypothetical protein